ncbi:14833_t:CDS:2 [Acaulospora morrowiae]|uniref:14833_t:CDS:1 n=1 Tax=Acaulospora morrowiae TaxID=94023 RepID=A0A9N9DA18_9GLOM|nr:14833_t:CDS:2 [Acaulospora morrowiae]
MTDYPRTEHYQRAPHTNYNNQVYNNLENSYMPTQETNYDTSELNTARVNNMNGHTSHPPVATYQTNGHGFSMNYGNPLSEISTYQTNNLPRNGPNGISVNTTNLPLSNMSIINTSSGRIICVANAEGNISIINKLADETGATAVIHTGDFGFYEKESLERISDRQELIFVQLFLFINDQ